MRHASSESSSSSSLSSSSSSDDSDVSTSELKFTDHHPRASRASSKKGTTNQASTTTSTTKRTNTYAKNAYVSTSTSTSANTRTRSATAASKHSTLEAAQDAFREATALEIRRLTEAGNCRSDAVQILLKRIAGEGFASPNEHHISNVAESFHISREDAGRALIVKEELTKLKQLGFDNISAIDELTHRLTTPSLPSLVSALLRIDDDQEPSGGTKNTRKRKASFLDADANVGADHQASSSNQSSIGLRYFNEHEHEHEHEHGDEHEDGKSSHSARAHARAWEKKMAVGKEGTEVIRGDEPISRRSVYEVSGVNANASANAQDNEEGNEGRSDNEETYGEGQVDGEAEAEILRYEMEKHLGFPEYGENRGTQSLECEYRGSKKFINSNWDNNHDQMGSKFVNKKLEQPSNRIVPKRQKLGPSSRNNVAELNAWASAEASGHSLSKPFFTSDASSRTPPSQTSQLLSRERGGSGSSSGSGSGSGNGSGNGGSRGDDSSGNATVNVAVSPHRNRKRNALAGPGSIERLSISVFGDPENGSNSAVSKRRKKKRG